MGRTRKNNRGLVLVRLQVGFRLVQFVASDHQTWRRSAITTEDTRTISGIGLPKAAWSSTDKPEASTALVCPCNKSPTILGLY